ncbi:dienelactone hydrolase family protein [Nannocystis sp. SCPEA4]|uniref:dienelactone hydrolase family protein n=1 Tax=Nannocystis sp. SCPEA4 TaxID=2996787 RepID=UPI00226F1B83|nr:dienelactone hydrolase family protein [Nannocystis sp. SCPEA4]MCY1059028.1 dienelactone hydrolase family protein [Nannocystis sp. SCPEA4]
MVRRFTTRSAPVGAAALASALAVQAPAIAAAQQPARVEFRSADTAGTPLTGYLYRPAGPGPFPAVIALHGCSGLFSTVDPARLSERHDDWAERLVRQGYVVLFPDSFGPRGVDSLCRLRGPRPVTVGRRTRDAEGAAAWLARQPFVDPGRLALLGWSHGGTSVLSTTGKDQPRGAVVRAAVAFYPGCRRFLADPNWRPQIPLTILIGSDDDWTPAEPCRQLAQRFPRMIDLVEFPGAVHGFDAPAQRVHRLTDLAYTASGTGTAYVGTEPQARKEAIKAVKLQLDRAFGRP